MQSEFLNKSMMDILPITIILKKKEIYAKIALNVMDPEGVLVTDIAKEMLMNNLRQNVE
jgi:hypothetical protein